MAACGLRALWRGGCDGLGVAERGVRGGCDELGVAARGGRGRAGQGMGQMRLGPWVVSGLWGRTGSDFGPGFRAIVCNARGGLLQGNWEVGVILRPVNSRAETVRTWYLNGLAMALSNAARRPICVRGVNCPHAEGRKTREGWGSVREVRPNCELAAEGRGALA